MDILLDEETGDVVFINGVTTVTNGLKESLRQGLTIALKTFRGEWFLDTDIGVPYFTNVFKKVADKSVLDIIFQEEILKDPRVSQITYFQSTLTSDRVYSFTFRVQDTSGALTDFITVNPLA